MGGRKGKVMVPPVVARRGSPLAWEREIGGTGEGVNRWERLGREDERKRMCDAPESGIWGEERATSNVEGVKGVLVGVTCRGIALASLGLPPPEGSWGCPASSPRGIIGTLGGPGTGSKHKPGLKRLWSSVVAKTVPVWPSVHPDPHRCPHPEGCCGSVVSTGKSN